MLSWNLEATYLELPSVFFSLITTDRLQAPAWAVFNTALAEKLGLGSDPTMDDLAILSGSAPPPGVQVFAQSYAGHQFGHFTMLGDGRAAVLGEVSDPTGKRWDLQLKGSGPTPYARGGDGKAVLGPMLREYLIGEYLHAAGLPTTRSLSVVLSGETILRDGPKPGAVLCRVAGSHLRVGTFQFASALADPAALRSLADYAISRHYPEARCTAQPYLAFLDAAGQAQAELVARWMSLGFVHGVMNTDNVSISGQAIDFGPCAFLDSYHSGQVFSSIDRFGRYAWGQQPSIATWNHARLAEALLPLLDENRQAAIEKAEEAVERFAATMEQALLSSFSRKLGLSKLWPGDEQLIRDLLHWMEEQRADFTTSFRRLGQTASGESTTNGQPTASLLPDDGWLQAWLERIKDEPAAVPLMQAANPPIHPRNRPVQAALDAAEQGDLTAFHRLARALAQPWDPASHLPELEADKTAEQVPFRTYCGT